MRGSATLAGWRASRRKALETLLFFFGRGVARRAEALLAAVADDGEACDVPECTGMWSWTKPCHSPRTQPDHELDLERRLMRATDPGSALVDTREAACHEALRLAHSCSFPPFQRRGAAACP